MTITLHTADCLDVMANMEDNSVNLIATDPPYFKVKDEWWDRQWDKPDEFLAWIDRLCQEWRRILKPNGSLYVFAAPQRGMARKVANVVEQHFNVLNEIRWYKDEGWHKKAEIATLRQNLMPWEGIVLAEHYGADGYAAGEAGWTAKCDDLRGFVFEPLRAYLAGEWKRAGLNFEDARQAVGCADGSGLPSHWFTTSQWMLPTSGKYRQLRIYANANGQQPAPPYGDFHDAPRSRFEPDKDGDNYEYLRADYEYLRRPFNATAERPYTDVWTFPTVSYFQGKHPAEKPEPLMEHIVLTSSRPGDVVADFFMGRGTTAIACLRHGRDFVGVDVMDKWVKATEDRIALEKAQPRLL